MQRWEGTVRYRRGQSSASEYCVYEMEDSEGETHSYCHGMPAPFHLEDGAELRVTIEVVKQGLFKLNPWRVQDCERGAAEYWHTKWDPDIKDRVNNVEDGYCNYCGMSEKLIRIREAYFRLTGKRPNFVYHDPYDDTPRGDL